MTNEQYFISMLGFAPSAEAVEAALTDAEISGSGTYVIANSLVLKKAAVGALYLLLSTPDVEQGTGETVNKIKYDRNAILKRIALLEEEVGTIKAKPTIKGIHPW